MSGKPDQPGMSRRTFLATTATTAAAAALASKLGAQTPYPSTSNGPYTRVSLTDPRAGEMLAAYAAAIPKLLALSPNDPRNFYRNAFIHTLDCPHGNWWFLPWHRGYLGWWEQTVREFSGNPNFAFPYWDWTVQPFIPDQFWQGSLNPANFVVPYDQWKAQFTDPMNQFYASLSSAQTAQLQQRPTGVGTDTFATVQGFWNAVPSMYFTAAQARSLTEQDPNFDDYTKFCVSDGVVTEALASPQFTGSVDPNSSAPNPNAFGSLVASQHSAMAGFGILEGLPHNNVHNDTGGFMEDFLSPVDPIFMAHHSNIDRLWTVWTSDQLQRGGPILPQPPLLAPWSAEPFLFYINSQGQQVTQNKAGDYATVGSFNYVYTPGTGSNTSMTSASTADEPPTSVRRITGTLRSANVAFSSAAIANISVPKATLDRTADRGHLHAHITIEPPAQTKGVRFHVFVNPPDNELALDADHPSYAGTFEFFGRMAHTHQVTFTVPLTQSVRRLRGTALMRADQPLQIHVVPQTRGVALRALPKTSVVRVELTSF